MFKKILPLIVTSVLVFSGISYGKNIEENTRIYDIKLRENSRGEYQVTVPRIKGFTNKEFERSLNDDIENEEQSILKEFGRNSIDDKSKLDINYKIKANEDITSILINREELLNGEKTKLLNKYINIDNSEEKILELKDIFKVENYLEVLEEKSGENINGDEDFYIDTNGNLILILNNKIKTKEEIKEVVVKQEDIKAYLREKALLGIVILEEDIKLDIKGDISLVKIQIKGLGDKEFQNSINDKINLDIEKNIEKFKKEVEKSTKKDIEFRINNKVTSFENIISIEMNIYTFIDNLENAETQKIFYNIDTKNNKLLDLQDLFKDGSYKDIVNKNILDKININEKDYYLGDKKFKSLDSTKNFYIDGFGNVVIHFNQGEISAKDKGQRDFTISSYYLRDKFKDEYKNLGVRDLKKFILNGKINYFRDYMYISENGNLMIPIKQVMEELNIAPEFDAKTKILTVKKDNKIYSISLSGNQYKAGEALIILEDQAKSVNGSAYVPQLYIDRVLGGNTFIKDGILNINIK